MHCSSRFAAATRLSFGRRRLVAAIGLLATGAWPRTPGAAPVLIDLLLRPAAQTPRALAALMLDVTRAGARMVAVGERGTILLSDDSGRRWRQVPCPVSVTLTALEFADANRGWAVGHGGVVLATRDGGTSWQVQLDGIRAAAIERDAAATSGKPARLRRAEQGVEDGADKPLLALHVGADGRRVMAVGAFGTAYVSKDGGASWQSWIGRIDNPRGLHFNALRVVDRQIWLAGEQGQLLRSDDDGQSFKRLRTPYDGSWFALSGIGSELLVVAGLRGNVWWSEDQGAHLQRAASALPISFASALRCHDQGASAAGPLMLVNQAGMLLASHDRARTWQPLPVALPPGPPITRVVMAADGALVATTMAGMLRLPPIDLAAR